MRQLCERLARRGHDVDLLTYGQGAEVVGGGYVHHRIRRLPGDDAARSGPTAVKPLLDAMMVVALDRLLRRAGSAPYDVIHCHNYEGAMIGLAARLRHGVPVVYHSHNLMADELPTYFRSAVARRAAGRFGLMLDASVPRRADHAIALCGYSAGILRCAGVAADRLAVIPPAIVDDGAARDVDAARVALAGVPTVHPMSATIDPADQVVGYCGNLDAYQNLELLLDGFDRAASVSSRPMTLLAVTHARDEAFERSVRERGLEARVRLVVADDYATARAAMEASDVLVLPRRAGSGFPIKLLNYLSLGRPVVTAGCGAKRIEHGRDGLVVDDDDPADLSRALVQLFADAERSQQLGAAGRRRFLSDLTWDAVLPAMEQVYDAAVRAEPGVKAAQAV